MEQAFQKRTPDNIPDNTPVQAEYHAKERYRSKEEMQTR